MYNLHYNNRLKIRSILSINTYEEGRYDIIIMTCQKNINSYDITEDVRWTVMGPVLWF